MHMRQQFCAFSLLPHPGGAHCHAGPGGRQELQGRDLISEPGGKSPGNTGLSAQAGLAGGPVCCGLGQSHGASMWNHAETCHLVPFP